MESPTIRETWERSVIAFHLWSAEHELREADARGLTPAAREARARSLDRLSEYRRRGLFPRNDHEPLRRSPCFVDGRGTRCAVAHLMDESGAGETLHEITRSQNFHLVPEMTHPSLPGWAQSAGLTLDEVARIQPTYDPNPEQLRGLYYFAAIAWGSGILGLLSIAFNLRRSLWTWTRKRWSVLAGVCIGLGLLFVWLYCPGGLFAISMIRVPRDVGRLMLPVQLLLGPIGLLAMGAAAFRASRDCE